MWVCLVQSLLFIGYDTFCLVKDPHPGMSWLSGLVPEATSSVSPTTLAPPPTGAFQLLLTGHCPGPPCLLTQV